MLLELGQLYYERCEFDKAIPKFQAAAEAFERDKDFDSYLKAMSFLIRIYAEQDLGKKVIETKEALQDLVIKEGLELNSRIYYTLGICSTHKKQYELALEYFQKSLALALAKDNKVDMSYAIFGLANTYYRLQKYSDALKEIYNLEVFFEVLPNTDIRNASLILNGIVLQKMGRQEQALEVYWKAYDQLRDNRNLILYIYLLCSLGSIYREMGDENLAKVYLELAERTADPKNLTSVYKTIRAELEKLGISSSSDYDLVFDSTTKSVIERRKGKIDLKNQFILLDLLHLFAKNPGQTYSKEDIVEKVWGQKYDPALHDNRIYVTIKRLRKLIEPEMDKPKYIFRAKSGYFMNKESRILIN